MKNNKPAYSVGFMFSLLLHGLLIALLIYGFAKTVKTSAPEPVPEIMNATALDESIIDAEVKKLQERENLKKRREADRQERLEQKRKQEEDRLVELKKKHQAEQQRARDEEKQRQEKHEVEKQRLAELKKQQEEEQARLAAIKKKNEEAEKKRKDEEQRLAELAAQRKKEKAKREAEKKAAAEKAAKEEQRLAAERKKQKAKREADKKAAAKKAAREKQRLAAAREKQALAAKQKAENARRHNKAVTNAKAIIRQKVERSWHRPVSAKSGMSCIIRVKLIPGGEVIDAQVVKSSGDAAFDRSGESAVLRSSPLPLPPDRELFNDFRTFRLEFNPS